MADAPAGAHATGRRARGARAGMSIDDRAGRISAFVYGNVLVLAALATVTPEHADEGGAVGLVGGKRGWPRCSRTSSASSSRTGCATAATPTPREVGHHVWLAFPIVTSAALPALALAAAWAGWAGGGTALAVAFGIVAGRLALLGTVMARVSGQASSRRSFAAGFGLVAAVTFLLTH